jgi:hypothetical protein
MMSRAKFYQIDYGVRRENCSLMDSEPLYVSNNTLTLGTSDGLKA